MNAGLNKTIIACPSQPMVTWPPSCSPRATYRPGICRASLLASPQGSRRTVLDARTYVHSHGDGVSEVGRSVQPSPRPSNRGALALPRPPPVQHPTHSGLRRLCAQCAPRWGRESNAVSRPRQRAAGVQRGDRRGGSRERESNERAHVGM